MGPQDCTEDGDNLVLNWCAPDLTDGVSTETIAPGELVDAVHVNMRAPRRRLFARGTMVSLSSRAFGELCWTVNAYAQAIQQGAFAMFDADPDLAKHAKR